MPSWFAMCIAFFQDEQKPEEEEKPEVDEKEEERKRKEVSCLLGQVPNLKQVKI